MLQTHPFYGRTLEELDKDRRRVAKCISSSSLLVWKIIGAACGALLMSLWITSHHYSRTTTAFTGNPGYAEIPPWRTTSVQRAQFGSSGRLFKEQEGRIIPCLEIPDCVAHRLRRTTRIGRKQ